MGASLHVRGGGLADRAFGLPDGAVALLGRGGASGIVLDHPDVAPVHCLLAPARAAGRWLLIDAWSHGGTQVNGLPFAKGTVAAGDVVVIPAGVAHRRLRSTPDFGVVGAYPQGQRWDMCYGKKGERPGTDRNIARVPDPGTDPVYGGEGPLLELWSGLRSG